MNPFILSLGAFLLLSAAVSGWLFRTTAAPLYVKLAVPALAVALACWTPWQVSALMGFPLETTFASLPPKAELIAYFPYDDDKRVDLWLRVGQQPRAYSVPMTSGLKSVLRQAGQEQANGARAMLGKKGRKTPSGGYADIPTPDGPYELLPNAFSLPLKAR
jgi:hypothetical protein